MEALLIVRRLGHVAYATQIGFALVFLIYLISQLLDQDIDEFAGLTLAEVVSLSTYSNYLLMSTVATEFTVSGRGRRLRWASFFLVVIAYHFGGYHYIHFINTMGCFCCLGVVWKAAVVVGPVAVFVPMFGNILLCFHAAFLRNNK